MKSDLTLLKKKHNLQHSAMIKTTLTFTNVEKPPRITKKTQKINRKKFKNRTR